MPFIPLHMEYSFSFSKHFFKKVQMIFFLYEDFPIHKVHYYYLLQMWFSYLVKKF